MYTGVQRDETLQVGGGGGCLIGYTLHEEKLILEEVLCRRPFLWELTQNLSRQAHKELMVLSLEAPLARVYCLVGDRGRSNPIA